MKAISEGYNKDYKELIKKYFEQLELQKKKLTMSCDLLSFCYLISL